MSGDLGHLAGDVEYLERKLFELGREIRDAKRQQRELMKKHDLVEMFLEGAAAREKTLRDSIKAYGSLGKTPEAVKP